MRHARIRVAYCTPDFRSHPTSYLIAELIERHDRGRFEIFGISFGPDDNSDMRRRMAGAFDQFHDVRALDSRDIAKDLGMAYATLRVHLRAIEQKLGAHDKIGALTRARELGLVD